MASKKTNTKKNTSADFSNVDTTSSLMNDFVFMEKTLQVLNIGMATEKNIILYGPGGHGKSELTLAYFQEKGIQPYVITMGTGMTTDRLFGGLNIPVFNETGKIEYLVENSFMNHEYVIFEELFDAPDFILEQLKDILSSGVFRNGTQVYPIKTKFIVCCTNRTRDEFSKNMSLKALMERFPLELNVVWDNYTDIAYTKLLEAKFGVGNVNPIVPYILQEYAKNSIIISPRVAVTAYTVFEECGPEALNYIAEFSKKSEVIGDAIKKFESVAKLHELKDILLEQYNILNKNPLVTPEDSNSFKEVYDAYEKNVKELGSLKVSDDLVSLHSQMHTDHAKRLKALAKKMMIATTIVDVED